MNTSQPASPAAVPPFDSSQSDLLQAVEAKLRETAPSANSPPRNKRVAKRRGRPDVLDDAKRRTLLALLSNGSSRRVAARFVRCSPSTIARTAYRDPEFAEQLACAEQSLEIDVLRSLRNAARKPCYWRAGAWLLERRNPHDFALRPAGSCSADEIHGFLSRFTLELLERLTPDVADDVLQRLEGIAAAFEAEKEEEIALGVLAPKRPRRASPCALPPPPSDDPLPSTTDNPASTDRSPLEPSLIPNPQSPIPNP